LQGNFPAFFRTFPAGFSTLLAVIVVVGRTLFSAPFTDIGTEFAVPGCIFTVSRQRPGTQITNVQTFPAAVRTIIVTLLTDHFFQTIFAIRHTFQAGINTFLVIHSLVFFLETVSPGAMFVRYPEKKWEKLYCWSNIRQTVRFKKQYLQKYSIRFTEKVGHLISLSIIT
jgi:hypothetical protein